MTNEAMDRTFDELAQASPVVANRLSELRADWAPDAPPPTVAMGDVGHAIIEAIDRLGDEELARVSAAIETALAQGPKNVQDAVATGLLEAAISATDRHPGGVRFLRALGQNAKAYGRAWDTFTGRRTPGIWDESAPDGTV